MTTSFFNKSDAVRILRGPHCGVTGVITKIDWSQSAPLVATIQPDATDGAERPIRIRCSDLTLLVRDE